MKEIVQSSKGLMEVWKGHRGLCLNLVYMGWRKEESDSWHHTNIKTLFFSYIDGSLSILILVLG